MTANQLQRFIPKLRFDRRDEDLGECWTWTACRLAAGYGKFGIDGTVSLAHRIAYEHWIGPIPRDREIDHLCRNKSCVNPRHLEAVTRQANTMRGMAPVVSASNGATRALAMKGKPKSAEHRSKIRAFWARKRAEAA